MPKRRTESKNYWALAAAVGIPIITFVGGTMIEGISIADKLATKPYVDGRFEEARKYTDEKTALAVEKAVAHSDANHQDLVIKMESMNTQMQTNGATLSTKVDALSRSIQDLRDWMIRRTK